MHKKLVVACAAIAAFAAFVIAPVASASPILTSEGKAVAVGTEIKGNNTGLFHFEAPSYTILCSQVNLAATVTANSGTKIKMEVPAGGLTMSGTWTAGDCTSNWGPATLTWSKLCMETGATDNVVVTGCGANITLTTNITGYVTCKYVAASIAASFPTNADATVSFSTLKMKRETESIFCPPEITFALDMDLTTAGGGTLLIS